MTIYRLLRNTTFGPEEIGRLVTAYRQALQALGLKDRSDPITHFVAEKIIAVGRLGIEDLAEIAKLAGDEKLRVEHGAKLLDGVTASGELAGTTVAYDP